MYRGELFIGAPCRCSLLWLGYICFCDVLHFLVNSAVVGLGLAVLDKDHLVVARKRPSHLQMDSTAGSFSAYAYCVVGLRSLAGKDAWCLLTLLVCINSSIRHRLQAGSYRRGSQLPQLKTAAITARRRIAVWRTERFPSMPPTHTHSAKMLARIK